MKVRKRNGKIVDFDKTKIQNAILKAFKACNVEDKLNISTEIANKIAIKRGIERMSAQAVGGAVGRNPIAIIVPCHRVIGANGALVGYEYGTKIKAKLLELENCDKFIKDNR